MAPDETSGARMSDGFDVPCSGMWEFAADKASHVFYPDRALVDPPLTGVERKAFAQEIGNRREAWRDACDAHLWTCIAHNRTGFGIDDLEARQTPD